MRVIKVGGGCLNGKKTIAGIVDLIVRRGPGHVFVVSALHGITDFLLSSLEPALADDARIPEIIGKLKARHLLVARHLIQRRPPLKAYTRELEKSLGKLERLYYGLNFTQAITPPLIDVISSYGERLTAQLLAGVVRSRGISATYRLPHKIGLITDGKHGDATADLPKTTRNFQTHLTPLLGENKILFLPGFFGTSERGAITTFGRGGSDYSAAVTAVALHAERLDIWKDTQGFMSADPRLVPEARLIPVLSYEEAAELAYFGAKILHPRTVEPARRRKMKIAIRNTLAPDADGTLITSRSARPQSVIKSVAYDLDIGVLKVHASGVGARPGILGEVATCVSDCGINIKSVVTSQTCISLMLARRDLATARQALMGIRPRPFRKIDRLEDVALIGIVGDGIQHREGIAARCFTAVAQCRVNVEMISFGPSRAALYFLVKQKDLESGVNAIHSSFFSTHRCRRPKPL
jgi:aspartate kinase